MSHLTKQQKKEESDSNEWICVRTLNTVNSLMRTLDR